MAAMTSLFFSVSFSHKIHLKTRQASLPFSLSVVHNSILGMMLSSSRHAFDAAKKQNAFDERAPRTYDNDVMILYDNETVSILCTDLRLSVAAPQE